MKDLRGYIFVVLKNKTVRFYVFAFFGLIINACYIIFNLISGIIYGNAWFITVAAYYTLMVSVRYLILGNLCSADCKSEYSIENIKSTKTCGTLMLILGAPITGMIIYTVVSNITYNYSDFVFVFLFIYAAFNILRASFGIFSVKEKPDLSNLVNYVRMSSALLSLFNLQTSVFSAIGIGYVAVAILNFITGAAVSLSVLGFAAKIIKESDIKLHELIDKKEYHK